MKPSTSILISTVVLTLAAAAHSQTPPKVSAGTEAPAGKPGTTVAAAPQKPKPFSSNDTRVVLDIADILQYQLGMAQRLRGKFRETDKELVALGSKINKDATALWTPLADLGTAHGVDGAKFPTEIAKTKLADINKLSTIKDEQKYKAAFFDLFSKEARKNVQSTEAALKRVMDADLKAWIEKALPTLQSQADLLETTAKDLKGQKK
jgi:hypothetical protein